MKGSEYTEVPYEEDYDEDLRDPLLGPVPATDVEPKAFTVVDVARRIAAIRAVQKKIQLVQGARKQMDSYYREKEAHYEASIEELLGQIKAYLSYNGLKNLPTPQGTAYLKNVTEYEYDEEKLRFWLGELSDEERGHFTRTKVELDKMAIRSLPEPPDGLTIIEKEKVYVR